LTPHVVLWAAAVVLSVFREDDPASLDKRAQLTGISYAVAEFARTPEEAAFLLAWGEHETRFSLRVHAGHCRPWECDRGRARGPWQAHRNGMRAEDWARMVGVENTRFQAERAAMHARWALRQCPGDRVRGAFRVLGGLRCDEPLKGESVHVSHERVTEWPVEFLRRPRRTASTIPNFLSPDAPENRLEILRGHANRN
jgi:hypothetical protein